MGRFNSALHPRDDRGRFRGRGGRPRRDGRIRRGAVRVGIAGLNQGIRSQEGLLRKRQKNGSLLYTGSDRAFIQRRIDNDKISVEAARIRLARGYRPVSSAQAKQDIAKARIKVKGRKR